jgi:hypothetical protein
LEDAAKKTLRLSLEVTASATLGAVVGAGTAGIAMGVNAAVSEGLGASAGYAAKGVGGTGNSPCSAQINCNAPHKSMDCIASSKHVTVNIGQKAC